MLIASLRLEVIHYCKMLLCLKHTSHFGDKNLTGVHWYVLDFQTIVFQLKRAGGKYLLLENRICPLCSYSDIGVEFL